MSMYTLTIISQIAFRFFDHSSKLGQIVEFIMSQVTHKRIFINFQIFLSRRFFLLQIQPHPCHKSTFFLFLTFFDLSFDSLEFAAIVISLQQTQIYDIFSLMQKLVSIRITVFCKLLKKGIRIVPPGIAFIFDLPQFIEEVMLQCGDGVRFFSGLILEIFTHRYIIQQQERKAICCFSAGFAKQIEGSAAGLSSSIYFLTLKQSDYTVTMSDSASKSRLNRDAVGENQTLFDFLKRKKKYNLENTVNKSLHQHSYTKKKMDLDVDDQFPQTKDERTKYSTQYQSNREASRGVRQTITPKKIQFQEQKPTRSPIRETSAAPPQPANPPPQGRSFLSMISPIKNRATSALEQHKQERENIPKSNKKSVVKGGDNFTRKNMTKCINTIKETMHNLSDGVNGIKEKSHGLVVMFNPILNHLVESNHPISKQVGDLKNKLRSFEAMVNQIDTNNADSVVENFHKNIEQHLQFEEGQLKRDLERTKNDQLGSFKSQKQRIIDSLQFDNKKLIKQNDLLQRRLQKIQSSKDNIEESVTEREVNYVQQLDRLKQGYENTIYELTSKNQELTSKYESLLDKTKQYERELKNQRIGRENLEEKYREQIQQITEVKDAYLLNEIMVLKTEFNADIGRINELHRIKQSELLARLQKKEEQLNKKNFERGCDKQIESKILEEANQIKQQNLHLKSKADCIITDMYRMNEELFQHWMALKDIKILATRLGNYPQFKKIYQDLLFNDHLFR